jgi:hypothetical protein
VLAHCAQPGERSGAGTAKLFVPGLPCLIAGTWFGLKLFGRIDEATFRKIVLALLFVSGADTDGLRRTATRICDLLRRSPLASREIV